MSKKRKRNPSSSAPSASTSSHRPTHPPKPTPHNPDNPSHNNPTVTPDNVQALRNEAPKDAPPTTSVLLAQTRATEAPPANPLPTPSTKTPTSTSISLRNARHLYIHITPIASRTPSTNSPDASAGAASIDLDETTLRLHLLSALSSYLGDTGAAIPVDILKLHILNITSPTASSAADDMDTSSDQSMTEKNSRNKKLANQRTEAYLRVSHADGALFCAALAGWSGGSSAGVAGYRILGRGCWLAALIGHETEDLWDFGAG